MNSVSPLKYVTIYNRVQNIDILKSPGMIPYYISKLSKGRYSATLVTHKIDTYTYDKKLKDHLKFVPISPINSIDRRFLISLLSWLAKNARSIDVLHLYHIRLGTLAKSLIYKILNPNGFLYVKLDAEWTITSCFPKIESRGFGRFLKGIRRWRIVYKIILHFADLISVETKEIYEYLKSQKDNGLDDKLILNPYGVDLQELQDYEDSTIDKEKIMITVGRIGTKQKNTELLLDALVKIKDIEDWKIYIVGPIESSFEGEIKSFYKRAPQLFNKVIFTGNLSDRRELCSLYQKSRCFILTSTFESWALVLTEAAYYNNYLISTDVGCIKELLTKDEFGCIIPQNDSEELAKRIQAIMNRGHGLSKQDGDLLRKHCADNFSWEAVVQKLLPYLTGEPRI